MQSDVSQSSSASRSRVKYKVLSKKELAEVRKRLSALNALYKTEPDASERAKLKIRYKAELSRELESNLARQQKKVKTLEGELKGAKRDLERSSSELESSRKRVKESESEITRLQCQVRKLLQENANFKAHEKELSRMLEISNRERDDADRSLKRVKLQNSDLEAEREGLRSGLESEKKKRRVLTEKVDRFVQDVQVFRESKQ